MKLFDPKIFDQDIFDTKSFQHELFDPKIFDSKIFDTGEEAKPAVIPKFGGGSPGFNKKLHEKIKKYLKEIKKEHEVIDVIVRLERFEIHTEIKPVKVSATIVQNTSVELSSINFYSEIKKVLVNVTQDYYDDEEYTKLFLLLAA
jgi:hypothetical protein